jgi:hypothetical protein
MTVTPKEFATMMAFLSAGVGLEMGRERVEVYYELLRDLESDVLKESCRRALLEHEYNTIPPVALIRKISVEVSGPNMLTSDEAWHLVRQVIIGAIEKEEIPDIIQKVAGNVGWSTLRMSTSERARMSFISAYREARDSDRRRRLLPPAGPVTGDNVPHLPGPRGNR